jgi:hypothetical protein
LRALEPTTVTTCISPKKRCLDTLSQQDLATELLEVSNMHAQLLLIGVLQILLRSLHRRYGCEVETTHSLIMQYILNV